jgi:hypothetical protein
MPGIAVKTGEAYLTKAIKNCDLRYNNYLGGCVFLQINFDMETVIKVNPSELNASLLDKIKNFIGNKKNIDVTISLKEYDPDYVDALDRSIAQAESGEVVSMTMEEFVAYMPIKKQ